MIVPVTAISNLVLTQQIYSEEPNGAHAHYREPVPLSYLTSFQSLEEASGVKLMLCIYLEEVYSRGFLLGANNNVVYICQKSSKR